MPRNLSKRIVCGAHRAVLYHSNVICYATLGSVLAMLKDSSPASPPLSHRSYALCARVGVYPASYVGI